MGSAFAVVWGLRRIRGTRAETLTLQLAGWTLLAALGLIWGSGHRVDWRGFTLAYGAALAWAAALLPVNSALGTNYGFVNEPPPGTSMIDLLGPWPIYVFWLVILVGTTWALMTWPWVRGDRSRNPDGGREGRTPSQTQKTPGT